MTQEEQKVQELIDCFEKLENGHRFDAALFNLDLDWHKQRKAGHLAKAAAYRFAKNKVIRLFKLTKQIQQP